VPSVEELDQKSLQERNEVVLDTLTENIFLNFILKNKVFENLQINETSDEYKLYKKTIKCDNKI